MGGIGDIPRQLLRRARKSVGLPASSDVRDISSMLSQLKTEAEASMKIKITQAVISVPDLVALYDEDIYDAAEYVGLQLLHDDWFFRQPRHIYSTFVAYRLNNHSFNVTSSIGNEHHCKGLPERKLLSVYLSHDALSVEATVKTTNRTCPLDWAQHRGYFSTELGFPRWSPPDLPWKHRTAAMVQQAVLTEIRHQLSPRNRNVTDVLFLGERGNETVLLQTVLNALKEIQTEEPAVHSRDTDDGVLWIASEGASMAAWSLLRGCTPGHVDEYPECFSENSRKYENDIHYLL